MYMANFECLLCLLMINLLIFSQNLCFGPDSSPCRPSCISLQITQLVGEILIIIINFKISLIIQICKYIGHLIREESIEIY